MELIKAKNVCKQFAAPKKLFSKKKSVVNAMQDFTLSINEGEILGLIGGIRQRKNNVCKGAAWAYRRKQRQHNGWRCRYG